MTIKLSELHKALGKLKAKDAGANVYIDNFNLNISSSIDGLGGGHLLDIIGFTEKEQDAMFALGFMFNSDDKTWYRAISDFKLPGRLQ